MPLTAANAGSASSAEKIDGAVTSRGSSIWLWAAIAIGAVLRLIDLGHKSFWLDEIASVAIARRSAAMFWHFLWHDEGNMAAYYVVLQPWLHLGCDEGSVRLLSVIAGVLCIPLAYWLARKILGSETAVVAAGFFALNTCAISVSQEARAYSFLLLLVLLSTLLFVQLVERPSYGRAVLYTLVAALTFYFHYFGVLVPAAHAVSLMALPSDRRRRLKPLLLAAALLVVAAVPILWMIHSQDVGHIAWVGGPTWLELYHLGGFLAADSGKLAGAVLLVLDLVLVGIFLAGLRTAPRESGVRWRYSLLASLLLTPIALTLLASILRPAFYHRFLIVCLPAWVLMTAAGAQQVRRRGWRLATIAAVCALSLLSTVLLYRRASEDWRGAVQYLVQNTQPGDRVLYYESVGEFAGESYRDWLPGQTGARPLAVAVDPATAEWQQFGDAPHVWLVLYRTKTNDVEVRRIEQKLSVSYQRAGEASFTGISVIEFERQR